MAGDLVAVVTSSLRGSLLSLSKVTVWSVIFCVVNAVRAQLLKSYPLELTSQKALQSRSEEYRDSASSSPGCTPGVSISLWPCAAWLNIAVRDDTPIISGGSVGAYALIGRERLSDD